ncbi:MAG: methyltransferase domain-containing protein [Chitinophagaceae bacterium]|nr:methyltransferase domain-containing protein [Chitinophagaceae bacterium]
MSRFFSYLNTATDILSQYKGAEPFTVFLKKYFSQHKKSGSRDRKYIAHLCYCYFRLGKAIKEIAVQERIIIGLFICSPTPNELLEQLRPEWNEKAGLSIQEKLALVSPPVDVTDIFPRVEQLSDRIEKEQFCYSLFIQPDLFLRLRPGHEEEVKSKLKKQDILFEIIGDDCLALPNASKVDTLLLLNKEAVIQDQNSQRVGELFRKMEARDHLSVWDCCAASGGKSIMAKDILGDIELTVSDVRENIIHNLKKRFAEAGINKYKSIVADLTKPVPPLLQQQFDLIIADVPCSGSGTWSRTPEQLYYFDHSKLEEYSMLQHKIINTVTKQLKPGGYLLYITCSVFKKENELQISYIKEKLGLAEIETSVLAGYNEKADTMFASLLRKPL